MNNVKAALVGLGASVSLCGAAWAQAEAPQIVRDIERADGPGRIVFEHQCAPCHGTAPGADGSPMLPGTEVLTAKYEGALPGALELRSDLSAPVLKLFVRRGTGAMPMFRPSELSDQQIEEVADYLSRTAGLNQ